MIVRLLAICVATLVLTDGGLRAQDSTRLSMPDVDKRISQFDSRAVAAARHYYESPEIKAGLLAMSASMNKAMSAIILQKNPGLSPDTLTKVQGAVEQTLTERYDLILSLGLLAALQTFTTDEIIALEGFYSSLAGRSILTKMPQMAPRMGQTIQMILPDMLDSMRNRLRSVAPEIKT